MDLGTWMNGGTAPLPLSSFFPSPRTPSLALPYTPHALPTALFPLFASFIVVPRSVFGSACYIEDSLPVTLYLSYKYSGELPPCVS